MKLDTSRPKDWSKFIKDLGLSGLCKLLMQHCTVESWSFPNIVLRLEPAQQPFISAERADELRLIFNKYYECNNIVLTIILGKLESKKDIVDVVKSRMPIKKVMNGNYIACCPFHEEKTPSFTVSSEKQFYFCLGCGAHGDAEDFAKEFDSLVKGIKMEKEKIESYTAEPSVDRQILSALNHMAASLEGIEYELDHIKEALYANTPDP